MQEREICDRAFSWFHAAISAWHNAHFRYRDGRADNGGVEFEAALGVAQHYGLPTFLVDWTWDPMVALAFAMGKLRPGGKGTVFVRDFGDGREPGRSYNVLLPPPMARRVWRQRGLFSWSTVPPEDLDRTMVRQIDGGLSNALADVSFYRRVTFPVSEEDIAWAQQYHSELMENELEGIEYLTQWSREAALNGAIGSAQPSVFTLEDLEERCQKSQLDFPQILVDPDLFSSTEDVTLTMDYLDSFSVQRNYQNGSVAYFIPFLLTATVGMPFLNWTATPNALPIEDARAEILFDENGHPRQCEWHNSLRRLKAFSEAYPELESQLLIPRPSSKAQ